MAPGGQIFDGKNRNTMGYFILVITPLLPMLEGKRCIAMNGQKINK